MDINCIGLEGKRDEFRKYLETSGATEKLTMVLMKLYQEEERPKDAIGFIRKQLCEDLPDIEEIKAMREEIEKLTKEKEKAAQEKEIAQSEVKKTDSEIESVLETKFKAFDADETGHSLLKEYLTEDIFDNLKELKTDLHGSLLDNIQSGLTHFDSEIGVFASDQGAYVTFSALFNPILEDFHETEVETGEGEDATTASASQPDVDWGDVEELKDLDPEGLFIKAISITIGRALEGVPFSSIISVEKLQETVETIRKALTAIEDEEFKGTFHDLADIDEEQKKKWIEEGILFPNPDDKFLKAAETYRLWPMGRGLFLNEKKNFRVWANEEEHLQLTTFDIGGNLRDVYQRLVKVMALLGDLKFARDQRWGFLAHNLKNIGNTMRVSVEAKIPHLSLPENADKMEILSEGNHISFKDLGNGHVQLSNNKRMGVTEIDTIKSFEKAIGEFITAEKCFYAAA